MSMKSHVIDKINQAVLNHKPENDLKPSMFYLLIYRRGSKEYEVYGFALLDAKRVQLKIAQDFSSTLHSLNEELSIVGYYEEEDYVMLDDIFKDKLEPREDETHE